MEIQDINIELIVKFLNSESTDAETEELLKWAEESADNKKLYLELKDIWEVMKAQRNSRFNSDEAWQKFNEHIQNKKVEKSNSEKTRTLVNNLLRIAAAIIITFIVSWLIFSQKEIPTVKIASNEVKVPFGSKTQIVLPDGSIVWINAGSTLRYNTDFNDTFRIVNLEGEAFFDVVKNPQKPFIVKAGKLDVKAYGTSFNVKSYPEDDYIETTLVTGIVTIENQTTNKMVAKLKPNQKTVFRKEDGKKTFESLVQEQKKKTEVEKIININKPVETILIQAKPEILTAWKEQKLYINSETFDEIALKLERWYGVKIHFQDNSIKKEVFTGKFTHNEPIAQVLEAIKLTTRIKYTIKQNDIYISE